MTPTSLGTVLDSPTTHCCSWNTGIVRVVGGGPKERRSETWRQWTGRLGGDDRSGVQDRRSEVPWQEVGPGNKRRRKDHLKDGRMEGRGEEVPRGSDGKQGI